VKAEAPDLPAVLAVVLVCEVEEPASGIIPFDEDIKAGQTGQGSGSVGEQGVHVEVLRGLLKVPTVGTPERHNKPYRGDCPRAGRVGI